MPRHSWEEDDGRHSWEQSSASRASHSPRGAEGEGREVSAEGAADVVRRCDDERQGAPRGVRRRVGGVSLQGDDAEVSGGDWRVSGGGGARDGGSRADGERATDVDEARDDGCTSLYLGVEKGHGEIVRLLIDAGASVDKADNDGTTPLYIGAQLDNHEVMRLLIDARASVDKVENNGFLQRL